MTKFDEGKFGLWFHFGWSLALFLFSKFIFGNFYEVYEAIPPSTLTGLLMDGKPADIIYPIASVGLSHIYIRLYAWLPQVAWYDYFMAAYLISAGAVVFSAIHSALKEKVRLRYILLLNTLVFVLFFTPQILHWNFTRNSLTVCSAAFVWLALVWLRHEKPFGKIMPLVFNSLLFFIGLMIRPESGELIFILTVLFIFCYEGVTKKAVVAVGSFFVPVLVLAGYIYYDRHTTSEFYLKLEPVTEYQIWLGNIAGISEMKTPRDSMKYVALHEGIVNDPGEISYAFIEGLRKGSKILQWRGELFTRARDILLEQMNHFPHLIYLNMFLIGAALYFFYNRPRGALHYLLFHALFWGVMLFICYMMVLEPRLFSPLLFFYTAGNVIFLFHLGFFDEVKSAAVKLAFASAVFLAIGFNFYQMAEARSDYQKNVSFNRKRFHALEDACRGKMLVPDASVYMVIFFNNFMPFHNPDFSAFKKLFLTDFEAVSLTPAYRTWLSALCNCNSANLGSFFDYLYNHRHEVALTGTRQRWKIYESYLNMVHNKTYSFQETNIISLPQPNGDLSNDTISVFKII